MSKPFSFGSWLAPYFDRFVTLRRASGAGYETQARLLRAFDCFLKKECPQPPLSREVLRRYLASLDRLSPRGRNNVVSVLWPALGHALMHGAEVEELPERSPRPPRYWRERPPRILSLEEVEGLLDAARKLPPLGSLRPATTVTLLGLLYVTGLRIGEALALNVGDLNLQDRTLTVRNGKFGKSRSLPLRVSTIGALRRYLVHPCRPVGTNAFAPFFVSGRRRRLAYSTLASALKQACKGAGIPSPWPRPHDFRHTFAISRLSEWYAKGRDAYALLPILSTYLGHVSVENTRQYLIANGPLLQEAASRFAERAQALDEVLQ